MLWHSRAHRILHERIGFTIGDFKRFVSADRSDVIASAATLISLKVQPSVQAHRLVKRVLVLADLIPEVHTDIYIYIYIYKLSLYIFIYFIIILWGFYIWKSIFALHVDFTLPPNYTAQNLNSEKLSKYWSLGCERNDWSSPVSTERIAEMLIQKTESFQNTPARKGSPRNVNWWNRRRNKTLPHQVQICQN